MKIFRRVKWALPLALVMALVVVGVAMAITITVDGDEDTVWTTGSGGQTPGNTTDPNEGTITDNRDISAVYWTNDGTNFYIMIRTYGTPPSLEDFPDETRIWICIDTDNNASTGGSYANCNNMTGIDRFIRIYGTTAPQVYNGSFGFEGSGTLGYNTGATTPVIELSVTNAMLGLSAANCTQTMPMVLYFDNGTTDPDDNTPDSGTVNIGCGAPTAITLSDIEARNQTVWAFAAPVALIGLVAGGAVFTYKRRRA